jgi:hypothetical protein
MDTFICPGGGAFTFVLLVYNLMPESQQLFNILSHEGNVNQNDTEIPSNPSQNGKHQENKQHQVVVTICGCGWWKRRNPFTMLLECKLLK